MFTHQHDSHGNHVRYAYINSRCEKNDCILKYKMPTKTIPTGMGYVTAKRYNKMKDDMQQFAQSNERRRRHQISPTIAPSPFTRIGNAVRNIFAS